MKQIRITLLLLLAATTLQGRNAEKAFTQVNFSQVKIQDDFWNIRLENNALHTIPVCIDQIENKTGRIRNFENAAKGQGKHSGIFFDDSDVYKAVEGIAYSLVNNPDSALEAHMDEWIDKFAAAQQSDGYLNTFYTLTGLDKRWSDMDKHEMYCGGHLLEAAIAYYQATGKDKLLQVARRFVDHMMNVFGPGKRDWVPGHEEIELALCKLYQLTGERRYVDFAHWLLEERGHHYEGLGMQNYNQQHYQNVIPVRQLRQIDGHAVRAMYLFCGMADVASYIDDTGYMEALDSLWDNVTQCHMYVTGGIGVAYRTEGFSTPFDLPNYDAYCETCASIGMVLWNHRMNEWKGDARYVDVLERSLYNGVLAGVSLTGERFFYVNPLASRGNHHRKEWYGCACCPSNVCRFIPSLGSYIYGTSDDALWVNLYIGNEATLTLHKKEVRIRMQTEMPWQGTSRLTFETPMKGRLRLRIPAWAEHFQVRVNGTPVRYGRDARADRGYVELRRSWRKGDVVEVDAEMKVSLVQADPRVKEDIGQRAIQRGPLVYCAEEVDNPRNFSDISVSSATTWTSSFEQKLRGIVELTGVEAGNPFTLIPYYAWDNRLAGEMRVWLPWKE